MNRNIHLGWFAETEVEDKVEQSGDEDSDGNNSYSRVGIVVVIAVPLIRDKSMYTTSHSGEGTYIEERSSKQPQFLGRHCSVVITIGGRVAGAVPGDRIVEPLHAVAWLDVETESGPRASRTYSGTSKNFQPSIDVGRVSISFANAAAAAGRLGIAHDAMPQAL
jgi:hypothetical protein